MKKLIASLLLGTLTIVTASANSYVITFGFDDDVFGTTNPFATPITTDNPRNYTEDPVFFNIGGAQFKITLTAKNKAGDDVIPRANNTAVGVNSGDVSKIDDGSDNVQNFETLSFKVESLNFSRVRFTGFRLNNHDIGGNRRDDGEFRFSDSGSFTNVYDGSGPNPNLGIVALPTSSNYIEFTTGDDVDNAGGQVADGYRVRALRVTVPVGGSTLMMFGSGLLGLAGMRRLVRRK